MFGLRKLLQYFDAYACLHPETFMPFSLKWIMRTKEQALAALVRGMGVTRGRPDGST